MVGSAFFERLARIAQQSERWFVVKFLYPLLDRVSQQRSVFLTNNHSTGA